MKAPICYLSILEKGFNQNGRRIIACGCPNTKKCIKYLSKLKKRKG